MILFGLLRAAKAEEGLAARFCGREAALKIFFDGEFQVGGHFRVEIAIELRAAEEGAQAVKRLAKPVRHLLSLPSGSASTRPMTSASRCQ